MLWALGPSTSTRLFSKSLSQLFLWPLEIQVLLLMGSHLGVVRIHRKHSLPSHHALLFSVTPIYLFTDSQPPRPWRPCLFCSLLYLQHSEQCLRDPGTFFRRNEWMNDWVSEEHFREPRFPTVLWLCWLKLPQCVWLDFNSTYICLNISSGTFTLHILWPIQLLGGGFL